MLLYWILLPIVWVLAHILFRFKVIGRENLKAVRDGRAYVIAPNHIANLDPVLIAITIFDWKRLRILAKEELFKNPLAGWFLRCMGAVSIERGKGDTTTVEKLTNECKNGTGIMIFPEGTRVEEGENVDVRAVIGNFDDAQAGVKRIFSDEAVRAELDKRGYFLSSANSINWGRILSQVVYYISAYCNLVRDGALTMGDKVNFCVPTGNFGDILAAYYAKRMGLPVNKLICASNSNNVLTDFLRTGIYDRNRPFHTTISPSMDILISSNLERLLFDLSGENDVEIRMYMDALGSAGRYQVSDNIKAKLDDAFWGGCCSEEETEETIRRYWQDHNYLIDPHTAVAAEVLAQYRVASGDETPAVVVSTASPYKFCGSVLTAIGETPCGDGLELLDQLHAVSGVPVPCRLAELKGKSRRFDKTVEKQAMEQAVLDFLK